jgi:hypothetical protein
MNVYRIMNMIKTSIGIVMSEMCRALQEERLEFAIGTSELKPTSIERVLKSSRQLIIFESTWPPTSQHQDHRYACHELLSFRRLSSL